MIYIVIGIIIAVLMLVTAPARRERTYERDKSIKALCDRFEVPRHHVFGTDTCKWTGKDDAERFMKNRKENPPVFIDVPVDGNFEAVTEQLLGYVAGEVKMRNMENK